MYWFTLRLATRGSLLYDPPACQVNKLQRVQNTVPRILTSIKVRDHITPCTVHAALAAHQVPSATQAAHTYIQRR